MPLYRPEFISALSAPFTETQSVLDGIAATIAEAQVNAAFIEEFTPDVATLDDPVTRRSMYKIWWAYFDNKIYLPQDQGGYRDLINKWLGSAQTGNLAPIFNPVERAVRTYQYVFDGRFGESITIADDVNVDKKVNEETRKAIYQVWNWSGINEWKNRLLLQSAALGTTCLRVVFRKNGDEKKIMILPEHPSNVDYVEKDERGNITQLVLKYDRVEGEFYDETGENTRQSHSYIEYMSKDKFWMVRDGEWWNYTLNDGKGAFVDSKEKATVKNTLGFVPYVFILHSDLGSDFGVPCFYGRERQIDHLNALAAHIIYQIHKHVVPTWLIEAGGPAPDLIKMGDQNIWYVKKDAASTSQVSVKDLVSKLDLNQAISMEKAVQEELANSLPELKATDGAFLSHQSGGTVAELRTPAEQRILGARASIESGFIKAQKIAVSMGILYGLWNVGTGNGFGAMEKAFTSGAEDHVFNTRRALPLTVDAELTLAKAEQAAAAAENPAVPGVKGGNNVPVAASTTTK